MLGVDCSCYCYVIVVVPGSRVTGTNFIDLWGWGWRRLIASKKLPLPAGILGWQEDKIRYPRVKSMMSADQTRVLFSALKIILEKFFECSCWLLLKTFSIVRPICFLMRKLKHSAIEDSLKYLSLLTLVAGSKLWVLVEARGHAKRVLLAEAMLYLLVCTYSKSRISTYH